MNSGAVSALGVEKSPTGGLGGNGGRGYIAAMANFDPIFLGWLAAVCVLAVINWLRGR